jgi:two-component system, cell cycle sensor histidine kinase and response regulator CckA
MRIKSKILYTLLGVCLFVVLLGALAVNRLHSIAMAGVTREAQDVARVVGLLLTSDSNKLSTSAQEIVVRLHQTQRRDVVLTDSHQIVLADALPSRIGTDFTADQADEVGETIKDRQVRTFVEVNQEHPKGLKQIVVPVEGQSGRVVGAVVLGYSPLYNDLMRSTRSTIVHVVLVGFGGLAIASLFALYLGRSIVRPLQQLRSMATGFASGRTDLTMPSSRKDEIGELATAFEDMVQKRRKAENDLQRLHDDLEVRVAERTAELSKSNEALRTENTVRKRAEATMRESEEKFHQLADHITDAFWMTSPDLKTIHYISSGYEVIWARSTVSLYADPYQWTDAIHGSGERERVCNAFLTLAGNVAEVSIEYRIARPDGTIRWVHTRGFQVRDAAGKVVRLTGIASDITESKQVEETLRRQKTELQVLFDLTPAMIAFKDTRNGILRVNKRYSDAFGKPVEEIEGKSVLELHPEGAANYYAADLEVVRSGVPKLGIVETMLGRNGEEIWLQTDKVPVRDNDGKIIGIVVMLQDISGRLRSEQELRLLNSAVLQSKESILITDAELDLPGPRIVFVNPAFTEMTGYTAEEALGKTPRMLQGPRTDKSLLHRLRRSLERGETFEGEAVNYRKDGKEFDLQWQVAPIRDVTGKIAHFVAIQRDITARKRLEAQLFQSQKMETVGKLAGGVAHEFNSIMTAISGQSELLLTDLPPGSALAKSATEISKAAVRAATLTRQLLAYGRKQFLKLEILDLNAVILSMEGMVRHLMGGDVDTQIVPALDLYAIKADAGQIEQVVMNMAINARDAMPNGGKLTLETANVLFEQESVGRYPELPPGNYVMLAITDTGTEMSAEVKARAFEPFFSTKGVGQGTGLGLSTCYGIIKQSGGHISVYSELARGATFKIYLPQVAQQARIPIQRLDSPGLPRGTETILLVEDDPALLEMAATLLRRLGYTVLAAGNGIEALSLRQRRGVGHIDLLFTDVVMPHMSGKELSERVKALYPHTRILFTSAYTENAIIHQGVLDKSLALLQKPFTPSALAQKLREVLDQPQDPKPSLVEVS